MGYALFFQYFITQSDKQLVRQLDKDQYNEADLVEVKIALNLPYFTDSDQYERYDGEIEFHGVHYNFVKRKIRNDTLYLMCLPNTVKTQLYAARNDYAKQVNDMPANGKGEGTSVKKYAEVSEYDQSLQVYNLAAPVTRVQQQSYRFAFRLPHPFIDGNYRSPEAINA